MEILPNDSDGDALHSLLAHRSDLSKPMRIDFAVAVPDSKTGNAVAEQVARLGFQPDVYYDVETEEWTCYCTKVMVPHYKDIAKLQVELDAVSRPLGGKADGWGSFGNADGVDQDKGDQDKGS